MLPVKKSPAVKSQWSSDRLFGFTFALVFLIAGLFVGRQALIPCLITSLVLLIVSIFIPKLLRPLNRSWLFIGEILHKLTNPVVLGFVFWGVMTPTGWFVRRRGKDILSLKIDRASKSYWIARKHNAEKGSTDFRKQF